MVASQSKLYFQWAICVHSAGSNGNFSLLLWYCTALEYFSPKLWTMRLMHKFSARNFCLPPLVMTIMTRTLSLRVWSHQLWRTSCMPWSAAHCSLLLYPHCSLLLLLKINLCDCIALQLFSLVWECCHDNRLRTLVHCEIDLFTWQWSA